MISYVLKNNYKILLMFGLVAAGLVLIGGQALASDASTAAKQGLSDITGTPAGGESDILAIVRNVVGVLSYIVGIVSVIMIIVGGLKYITSSGDSSGVSSAKSTILYAVIGVVVATLAQVIVRFVIASAVK